MSAIKDAVTNEELHFDTAEELVGSVGVSQDEFEAAYNCCTRKTQVNANIDI